MFVINYYNEALAQWCGTGSRAFTSIDDARSQMRKLSEECNRCVSFKIIHLPMTDEEQLLNSDWSSGSFDD